MPKFLAKTPIKLSNRKLLSIKGDDAKAFLQGLITNDINKLNSKTAIYALMLTPQGKLLYDFFLYEIEDKIFLDCNGSKTEEITKKLKMYKLRSKVEIEDISSEHEIAIIEPGNRAKNIFADPRSPNLPERAIIKKSTATIDDVKNADYQKCRIILNIASDTDMEDGFPLDYEMDKHNAIDFNKGCYVGQEITARMHHRGTIKKRPVIVQADNNIDLSEYKDQELTSGDRKIGTMRGANGNIGIALVRIDDLEKVDGDIEVGGATLKLI